MKMMYATLQLATVLGFWIMFALWLLDRASGTPAAVIFGVLIANRLARSALGVKPPWQERTEDRNTDGATKRAERDDGTPTRGIPEQQ